MVGIVLLAMVAAFLAFKLYTVLGKRTGHEQPLAPVEERKPSVAVAGPEALRSAPVPVPDTVFEPAAAVGIRAIVAADPAFDVARFLDGAKAAYRMVLEAYWRADEAELATLADPDVVQAFAAPIAERKALGHVLNNRLISIERAIVADASLDGRQARIKVRFDAYIAAVTRDAEGLVVAGSTSDAVSTHDVWTFAREVRATDPNWLLIDTDESV